MTLPYGYIERVGCCGCAFVGTGELHHEPDDDAALRIYRESGVLWVCLWGTGELHHEPDDDAALRGRVLDHLHAQRGHRRHRHVPGARTHGRTHARPHTHARARAQSLTRTKHLHAQRGHRRHRHVPGIRTHTHAHTHTRTHTHTHTHKLYFIASS